MNLRPLLLLLALALAGSGAAASTLDAEAARTAIEAMKRSSKGPFERIRWYCADGSVLPPKAFACRERGGGVQHGQWSAKALALRDSGWQVANLLVQLDPADFVGPEARLDLLKQILLERFLISWDDGWIFRGARSYRGAIQAEDEEAGARRLVRALLGDPAWRTPARFFLLREVVRLLPLEADAATATEVRALAIVVEEKDPSFRALRAKIHGQPDAGDAQRVREHAARPGRPPLAEYEQLAAAIDLLYAGSWRAEDLEKLARRLGDSELATSLRASGGALAAAPAPREALASGATLLVALRDGLAEVADAELALALLQLSLAAEAQVYAAGNELRGQAAALSRSEQLALIGTSARALYGAGFLSRRQIDAVDESVASLRSAGRVGLKRYRSELRYLARTSEWSSRWIAFHFGPTVEHWARIEPEAHLFPQDRVRGSPLLFHDAVTDDLIADANALAGIQHELFGQRVGVGLRALNPGLARGVLRESQGSEVKTDLDGIYLLPETTSELGRVAGILTRGEGSSLSHVQLLARNLGIPNVVVRTRHLPELEQRMGERVVLAASPGGVVQLGADGPRWAAVFGRQKAAGTLVIRPDLEKLDLDGVEILGLDRLRAADSGRTSGPKGANLGELRHHFGDAVPDGVVIPFGVFRRLLDQPLEAGGPSVWEWMVASYDEIGAMPEGPEQAQRVSSFLARLRDWIAASDPGPEFRQQLRALLVERFGPDGTWGVFVRSDTNVEDLPGFTGAGLNLTVFNVVGVENVIDSIQAVWASPFTERAYGWRQANMVDPEYVMPAVVIQLAYPSLKSGVMATVDVETGSHDWLTVAVNEGVGGAVDGQAAESLKIPLGAGEVRLLAQATAPQRTVLLAAGDMGHEPASGADAVLQPGEIAQLVSLARRVSDFPSLHPEGGEALAADVEFGFGEGERLVLLQLRPLVESRSARQDTHLRELDRVFEQRGDLEVALDAVPPPTASTREGSAASEGATSGGASGRAP
ncbi:MAG: PEP/pyruvate-binding domain-containing protein [Myxococcota bacterium]|nr:PEP/pyruvate-binding domain-containing protein [Myxococcota bacterium]